LATQGTMTPQINLPNAQGGAAPATGWDHVKKGWGKGILGRGGVGGFSFGMLFWGGVSKFSDPSKSWGHHIGSAIGYELLFRTAPGIGWGLMGYEMAKGGVSVYKNLERENKKKYNLMFRNNFGGNYQDTQPVATMRQAGVQAIQASHLNGRSLLGQEASLMHR